MNRRKDCNKKCLGFIIGNHYTKKTKSAGTRFHSLMVRICGNAFTQKEDTISVSNFKKKPLPKFNEPHSQYELII